MNAVPSMDVWLGEAKEHESAEKCGMYLVHNGTVRATPKAKVREGADTALVVKSMNFSYDEAKLQEIIKDGYNLEGIYYIRAWLNSGSLMTGDDIMYVLIGGDIRPNVVNALNYVVGRIKDECVVETEIYE